MSYQTWYTRRQKHTAQRDTTSTRNATQKLSWRGAKLRVRLGVFEYLNATDLPALETEMSTVFVEVSLSVTP